MSADLPKLELIKTERERVLEKAIEDALGCLDAGFTKQAKACLLNARDWQYGGGSDPEPEIVP